MTTEQHIHDAFEVFKSTRDPGVARSPEEHFRAGYLAILNQLELGDWCRDSDNAPLYALLEGVMKP